MYKFSLLESCSHSWNENVDRTFCVKVVNVIASFFLAMLGRYEVCIKKDVTSFLKDNPQYKNTWFGIALEKRNIEKAIVIQPTESDSEEAFYTLLLKYKDRIDFLKKSLADTKKKDPFSEKDAYPNCEVSDKDVDRMTFPLWKSLAESLARDFDLPNANEVQDFFDGKIAGSDNKNPLRQQQTMQNSDEKPEQAFISDINNFLTTLLFVGWWMFDDNDRSEGYNNIYIKTYEFLTCSNGVSVIGDIDGLVKNENIHLTKINVVHSEKYKLLEVLLLKKKISQ